MTSSEPRTYDAVVIGGGHNGLVCAAMLAKSGRKVLLLEAAQELGGAARTQEFAPGFRASLAHLLNRLHPEVISALGLAGHGLKFEADGGVPSIALSADRRAADARRRLWRKPRRRIAGRSESLEGIAGDSSSATPAS